MESQIEISQEGEDFGEVTCVVECVQNVADLSPSRNHEHFSNTNDSMGSTESHIDIKQEPVHRDFPVDPSNIEQVTATLSDEPNTVFFDSVRASLSELKGEKQTTQDMMHASAKVPPKSARTTAPFSNSIIVNGNSMKIIGTVFFLPKGILKQKVKEEKPMAKRVGFHDQVAYSRETTFENNHLETFNEIKQENGIQDEEMKTRCTLVNKCGKRDCKYCFVETACTDCSFMFLVPSQSTAGSKPICESCQLIRREEFLPLKFQCNILDQGCSESFWSLNSLVQHTKKDHPSFICCDICAEQYTGLHNSTHCKSIIGKCSDYYGRCHKIDCRNCSAYICGECLKTFPCTKGKAFWEHCNICPRKHQSLQETTNLPARCEECLQLYPITHFPPPQNLDTDYRCERCKMNVHFKSKNFFYCNHVECENLRGFRSLLSLLYHTRRNHADLSCCEVCGRQLNPQLSHNHDSYITCTCNYSRSQAKCKPCSTFVCWGCGAKFSCKNRHLFGHHVNLCPETGNSRKLDKDRYPMEVAVTKSSPGDTKIVIKFDGVKDTTLDSGADNQIDSLDPVPFKEAEIDGASKCENADAIHCLVNSVKSVLQKSEIEDNKEENSAMLETDRPDELKIKGEGMGGQVAANNCSANKDGEAHDGSPVTTRILRKRKIKDIGDSSSSTPDTQVVDKKSKIKVEDKSDLLFFETCNVCQLIRNVENGICKSCHLYLTMVDKRNRERYEKGEYPVKKNNTATNDKYINTNDKPPKGKKTSAPASKKEPQLSPTREPKLGKRFANGLILKFHCRLCHQNYLGINGLIAHCQRIHPEILLWCKVCGEQFYTHKEMSAHDHSKALECECGKATCLTCAGYVCRTCYQYFRCDEDDLFKHHHCRGKSKPSTCILKINTK